MNAEDRPEFDKLLAELFAALGKPLFEPAKEGFWKGLMRMSILEFTRVQCVLLEECEEGETKRAFSVNDIWAARRRLRAKANTFSLTPAPAAPQWQGDGWDMAANMRLWRYLTSRMVANPQAYGKPASRRALRQDTEAFADASPRFVQSVELLVRAKKAWASDMRELASNGSVELPMQNEIWLGYIADAEKAIAALTSPAQAAA